MSQEESVKPLSKDEAWMLFRRTAFKGNGVPTDIEEYATQIADECQGIPLAISLVAAAMMGKTTVDEWKASLSSIKNADPSSFPDTLDPQLYRPLRWAYDALPNSELKNCFLYCAMYPKDQKIPMQDLVPLWIAEGLVRSKQENHLMDMAIGRSYVNLLVDHCFFQNATDEALVNVSEVVQHTRVHHVIHDMAIYIGEEENCLFKAGQGLQDFPTIHNDYKRISLRNNDIKSLPAEFPCSKLVSLFLSLDYSIKELPSRFLVSLESLKVLHLHSQGLESIPSSVGQLKQLEFLSLKGLKNIHELPEEICHLSSLQFLDLSDCDALQSLPSKIGELKNLKHLRLPSKLKVIPREISQLTSLSTLEAREVELSLEAESAASIWSLKGFRNLNTLRIMVKAKANVQEGITSSGIEVGIMGTWLEMRHLVLDLDNDVMVDLPHDMRNMRKLQSLEMWRYQGSSLPDYTCKFRHLENIALVECHHLRELSPLERLPNLKVLLLYDCKGLKELGIGNSGRSSGFLMLQKLVLLHLLNLESIAGPSNNGVWSESTLSRLRVLRISECPNLKRLPVGMDKLPNLITIFGEVNWWHQIIWENDDMKIHFENLFKKWRCSY
jgi:disease resistance protein RPS2